MANFVRKLKKGTNKYKGMLPLKCFNCGGIGHFDSKFPHRNKYSDEEEISKREKKFQKGNKRRNKRKFFKKILYSKRIVLHQMRRIMTMKMIQKEYSSWN